MTPSTSSAADSAYLRTSGLHAGADGAAAMATSGVSWSAIFAGAAAAAALSMILLILGTGLGLSSVSPWRSEGLGAVGFGVSTILWITFTQLAASGMGGYLAGRLRSKWAGVHTDEVYFRDTAHGFLAWAVASLVTAAALTTAIGSIVAGGAQVGTSMVGATAAAGTAAAGKAATGVTTDSGADAGTGPMGYFVDSLFRSSAATPAAGGTSASSGSVDSSSPATSVASMASAAPEVGRIFANAVRSGALPADDLRYVGQLVSQRTGLGQAEAEKRVGDAFARLQAKLQDAEASARDAADKARKGSAYASLWLFVSLLAGAFVASLCATYGGRRRDGV